MLRVPVAAECYAETSLAEELRKKLTVLQRPGHKPSRGGRERVITESIKLARRSGRGCLVIIVDEEVNTAARLYVERLCRKKLLEEPLGGARVKLCLAEDGGVTVLTVVLAPRSEEVAEALGLDLRDPRRRKRFKSDPRLMGKALGTDEGRRLVEKLAEALRSALSRCAP